MSNEEVYGSCAIRFTAGGPVMMGADTPTADLVVTGTSVYTPTTTLSPATGMTLTRALRRFIASLLFAAYLVVSSTFLLFTVLELFPSLATNFQQIRYYAQSRHYRPDPTLVFIPSGVGRASRLDTEFFGDHYSPDYGVPHTAIPYRATYTLMGSGRTVRHRLLRYCSSVIRT